MIAKILIDICCKTNKYNKCEIDYLISDSKFKERRELIKFKKMINDTIPAIELMKDDTAIELIKSEKLLRAVLKAVVNDN